MTTAERNSIRETERERIKAPCIGEYPLTMAERNRICSALCLLVDDACGFLELNNPKMASDKSWSAFHLAHILLTPLWEDKAKSSFQENVYWLRQHLINACCYLELNRPKKALEQVQLARQLAQRLSPHPSQP